MQGISCLDLEIINWRAVSYSCAAGKILNNRKILIVDDDVENLRTLSGVLRGAGYEILESRNAIDGLTLAKKEKPHLIVTDIHMPLVSGFQFLRNLKADTLTKDIPTIALGSFGMSGRRESFLNYGFADFIPKPVNMRDLVAVIQRHVVLPPGMRENK